jgi:hypothetical protein
LIAGAEEPRVTVQSSTGFLRDPQGKRVHAQFVLADPSAQIEGTPIASDPDRAFILYRVDGYLRTATQIEGWNGDSWTGPNVSWLRRGCLRGTLTIPVHTDQILFANVTQRIAVTGTTPKPFTVVLPSTASKTISVPLKPVNGVCRVQLAITPTRRPSDYPALNNPDPRDLGVLATGFQYEPAPGA